MGNALGVTLSDSASVRDSCPQPDQQAATHYQDCRLGRRPSLSAMGCPYPTLNGLPADRCERLKWIKDRTVADMGKLDLLPFFINAISKASVPGMWASNGSTDASKSLAGICRISGAAFCHGQWAPFRAFWDLAAIATLKASDGEKAELTIIASMTIGAAKHPDDRATSTRAHRASANTTNGSGPNRAGPSTVHRAVQAHILRT